MFLWGDELRTLAETKAIGIYVSKWERMIVLGAAVFTLITIMFLIKAH